MNRFDDEIQRAIDTAARRAELLVLIWGPGDPGEDGDSEAKAGYEKRCLMRNVLREKFPQSRFEFSEDLSAPGIIGRLQREKVHAEVANLVIILAISPGALLELAYFARFPWFRSKAWVFVPEKFLGTQGLFEEVYDSIPRKQIQGFTPDEFKQCDVAKRRSVNIVLTAAKGNT